MSLEPSVAAQLPLDSGDIAKILLSTGPVVKCVLLKAPLASSSDNDNTTTRISGSVTQDDNDEFKSSPVNGESSASSSSAPAPSEDDSGKEAACILLNEHMGEIELDTTPAKSMVSQILGGPFTFLGQYEDEGIVLMVRRMPPDLDPEELPDLKLSELKALCQERELDMEKMLEKSDLIQALAEWSTRQNPPWNPHPLQPPLHKEQVRGDILVLKVAETKEELDDSKHEEEDGDNDRNNGKEDSAPERLEMLSNEDFFLNYSLDEYIRFASRTDIPEPEMPSEDEEEEDGEGSVEEEDEEDDGDSVTNEDEPHSPQGEGVNGEDDDDDTEGVPLRLGDEEEIDEEDKAAMFNLVMNEVLRQYREENGRGPDTKELLEMRATIAKELDVQVAHIDAEQADWNKNAKDGTPAKETAKTIGFHTEDKVLEYQPDPNEHNHHGEEYVEEEEEEEMENDDEAAGYEDGEPAHEDEIDQEQPPSKRPKLEDPNETEQEDSKPAAVSTVTVPEAADPSESQTTDSGDSLGGKNC